jgi:uncharacterized protein
MENRSLAWFGAAPLAIMVASQIVRLHQTNAGSWIFWDYAGRLTALAMLAALPAARAIAFRSDKCQMSLWQIPVWIVGICSAERLSQPVNHLVNEVFPMTVLGAYPRPSGWLYFIDLVFGLALVAVSEEISFGDAHDTYCNPAWVMASPPLQPLHSCSAAIIGGLVLEPLSRPP